jgi:antagonist of KipI
MSLKIIKAGLLDTVQDWGRYGYQHQGINPGGVMDRFSASLANALLGKDLYAPVLELHFPASQILFQKPTIICLAGADFHPLLNGEAVSMQQPLAVSAGTVLSFSKKHSGARCYIAVLSGLQITPWLNSYSTNLKAAAGGFKGRRLEKGDEIALKDPAISLTAKILPLPWSYGAEESSTGTVAFLPGPEWNWLDTKTKTTFLNEQFRITPLSDRMGYRLQGEALPQVNREQLLSCAVNFGTVQLLPNGQLIVLMADHQTTGGYPRIANVISAHLCRLAQMNAGDTVQFEMTDITTAEKKWLAQQTHLQKLQETCKHRMQSFLQKK